MRKWLWVALLALPLAAASTVIGMRMTGKDAQKGAAYVCPVTGEELPCPDCCPFQKER